MLLRVKGTASPIDDLGKCKLELEIPALYLADANYNISLRMIMLDVFSKDSTRINIPFQFWSLSTSAVDQTAVNPMQEIASFSRPIKLGSDYTGVVYYEPSIKREYKIQITSIHTSEFILTAYRQDASLEIKNIEILFEISRYARV